MKRRTRDLQRRLEALNLRVEELSSLRRLVGLPPEHDIHPRQWAVIESQLTVVKAGLVARLKRGARAYLPQAHESEGARQLNVLFGDVELELARAFTFFDTYMDILTQRHPSELGALLAGCDALAWDSVNRDHPALAIVERPLVYCDRGFGASTVREGVLLPDRSPNPMPIIQIPYSRLKEKYNLTSVLHEVGHEAMVRLGLRQTLPEVLRAALDRAGASETVQSYFALWTSEIGPDFWTFCGAGIAAAGGIREILALPPSHAFRVAWTDPHPPPFLRARLVFDWCRQAWGADTWDEWDAEWRVLYPLDAAPPEVQDLLREATTHVPVVSRALLNTRFRVLNGRKITDLFDLGAISPARLRQAMRTDGGAGGVNFKAMSPSAQLGVWRLMKEESKLSEEALDRVMTSWLLMLGREAKRRSAQQPDAIGSHVRHAMATGATAALGVSS